MFYWLFKKYTSRLISEYKEAYEAELSMEQNPNMRPDFYWLENYLAGKFKWVKRKDGAIVRRDV